MADLSIQREGGPSVAPLLRVERFVEGGVVILRATGEIDLSTTPLLAERSQRYADLGARLTVVAPHRAVLRSIELTGLTEIITVVPSVEEAVAR